MGKSRKVQIKISLPPECVAWLETQIGDRSDVIYHLLLNEMAGKAAAVDEKPKAPEPSGFDMWQ